MSQSKIQIFNTMSLNDNPEEIIKKLYDLPTWFSYVNDRLTYKEYIQPCDVNEDLDYLIACYVNKKSKLVKNSGAKLRKVFLELPHVEQRKVGLALLTGGKTDTEWVCQRLDNYKPSWDKDWVVNWHPCYSNAVEDAWIRHRGKFCGRLLIQFLDTETIRRHFDELLEEDELYFGLCRRFIHEDWFVLDRKRLAKSTSINAYLSIMSQTPAGITEEEARKLLYQWIATVCFMCKERFSTFKREKIFWRKSLEEHRVIYAWGIDTALLYLLKMGKQIVISDFLEWDENVHNAYINTLDNEEDSADNQERFVDVILEKIPEEYKYLSYLNSEYYDYAFSAGQPFTVPLIKKWYKDEETRHAPYLSELNDGGDTYSVYTESQNNENILNRQIPFGSDEEFKLFMIEHPGLQELVDELDLIPDVSIRNKKSDIDECPF